MTGNCFKGITTPELDGKVVELNLNCCSCEFSEGWFKVHFPRRHLEYDAINGPWTVRKKALQDGLIRASDEEKTVR